MNESAQDALKVCEAAILASLSHRPISLPDLQKLTILSLSLWEQGRVSEAVAGFRLLERNHALPKPGLLAWGWWLLYEGWLDKAQKCFSRVLKDEPRDVEATLGLAYLRFYQEKFTQAAALFVDLLDRTQLVSPQLMASAAEDLAEGRRPEQIEIAPIPGLPPGLAQLLQKRTIDGVKAAIEYGQRVISSGLATSPLPIQRTMLEWRVKNINEEPIEPLCSELQALLEQHPLEGRLWQFYGIVLGRQGLSTDSVNAFYRATAYSPLEAGTYAGVGASLMESQEYEYALPYYGIALSLQPDNGFYHYEMALSHAGLRRWQQAIEKFTDALNVGVVMFEVYFNRGLCYFYDGDNVKGTQDFRKALETDPSDYRCAQVREILDRGHP